MTKAELLKRTERARRDLHKLSNELHNLAGFANIQDDYDVQLHTELKSAAEIVASAHDLMTRREIKR